MSNNLTRLFQLDYNLFLFSLVYTYPGKSKVVYGILYLNIMLLYLKNITFSSFCFECIKMGSLRVFSKIVWKDFIAVCLSYIVSFMFKTYKSSGTCVKNMFCFSYIQQKLLCIKLSSNIFKFPFHHCRIQNPVKHLP